jgi:hypothetical protein
MDKPKCLTCNKRGHSTYECLKYEKEYMVYLYQESDDKDNLIHCIKCNSTNHTINNCPLLRKKQRKNK